MKWMKWHMIITFLVADACEVVAFGGHRISLEVAGVALLILGFLGMIFSTYVLHMPQRCLPLRPTDEELFSPAILGDGEALHTAVGQNMWCVNLEDLRQLRRLVMHAVARGTVRPTDRDPFDLKDYAIGPSVYTVTEQFLKPITGQAGQMSWALMKHADGLPCDLFVTHAWAEGIYELIARVEHSWPRGMRGAYICFLSNPQNLNIEALIASPRESPFALALQSASLLLVCPNEHRSIYTRLWCVYEAFLAYSWQKEIRTATKYHEGFYCLLMRWSFWYVATAGLMLLLQCQVQEAVFSTVGFLIPVCTSGLLAISRASLIPASLKQLSVAVFAATLSMYTVEMWVSEQFMGLLLWCGFLTPVWLVEFERLKNADAAKRTKLLSQGFSGIMDAACASEIDQSVVGKV